MTSRDCIIVDEAHTAAAETLKGLCDKLENGITEYISILNSVTAEAAKEGMTTERYEGYQGMVSGLEGEFERLGNMLNLTATEFVSDVDDADSYLY